MIARQAKRGATSTLRRVGWQLSRLPSANDTDLYERVYSAESLQARAFYNIGSGNFYHPYWTNVDLPSAWYQHEQSAGIDVAWDAESLSPLPIKDASAEAVYTSHTIEHLTDQAVNNLFREAYRVLRPTGLLRVTTPNIDLDLRAWRDRDRDHWYWAEWYSTPEAAFAVGANRPLSTASVQQLLVWQFASALSTLHVAGADDPLSDEDVDRLFTQHPHAEALEKCVSLVPDSVHRRYPGNHRNWWTLEKAERMLREAGFEDVRLSGYAQSHSPAMRNVALFDSTHPRISLYVEATR